MNLEKLVSGSLKHSLISKFENDGFKFDHKHKVFENQNYDVIDPVNSRHVKSLQRSKYLSVEKDLNILSKIKKNDDGQLSVFESLSLRYCLPEEVNKKR